MIISQLKRPLLGQAQTVGKSLSQFAGQLGQLLIVGNAPAPVQFPQVLLGQIDQRGKHPAGRSGGRVEVSILNRRVNAGIGLGLSWLLHGCPFDRSIDALMVFFTGISISLFAGAIFFPLFYLGGEERNGAFLVISLLCAIGIVMGITTFINITFGPEMTIVQILLGAMIMLVCSLTVFALSYPVTTAIFKRKEY